MQDKASGNSNVGSFWISVYSDKPSFRLEGGEKIVEEEEGEDEVPATGNGSSRKLSTDRNTAASSLPKSSTSIVATGPAIAAEKRRQYEDAKEELLRQAKRNGIGLQGVRAEFAKTTTLSKTECRRKLQTLGFKIDGWNDEMIGLLFGGLEDGSVSGVVRTDKILQVFLTDIREEQVACETPDLEADDDTPEKLHREGILEIELHGATGLAVGQKRKSLGQRKIRIPATKFSASERALRRKIASEILERNRAMAWQLRRFAKKAGLFANDRSQAQEKREASSFQASQIQGPNPIEAFFELLEKEYVIRIQARSNPEDEDGHAAPISRTPVYLKRDGVSPFTAAPSSKGAIPSLHLNPPSSSAIGLHKSDRIRELEDKRSTKLALLLQHKQQALGDAAKTSALPRLIGGRKSGSNYVQCVDCGARVLVTGRGSRQPSMEAAQTYACNGSNCVNTFCLACFALLPTNRKLCEECFQHEISPVETFGEQLRAILIEKIGASDQQRTRLEEVFRSFDEDGSGSLSAQEFGRMLQLLDIQPALSQDQKTFIMDQFDTNADGEISLTEFSGWILKDRVWEEQPAIPTSRENDTQTAADVFSTVIAPLCDEIVDLAYDAFAFSSTVGSWSYSSSSTKAIEVPRGDTQRSTETGVVIFQRVVNLGIAPDERGLTASATDKIFEQFDNDGSGQIDQAEFSELLSTLGIHLHRDDTKLLMNRLGTSSADHDSDSVGRAAFMAYVDKLTAKKVTGGEATSRSSQLTDVLVRLETLARSNASIRVILQDELQQLHENMREVDLRLLCRSLEEKTGLLVQADELERLSTALAFHADQPEQSNGTTTVTNGDSSSVSSFKSSGDILAGVLLSESSDTMQHLTAFNLSDFCSKIATHLETRIGTTSTASLWKSVFGVDVSNTIHLNDFLSSVLQTGFIFSSTGLELEQRNPVIDRLTTQLLLSLALEAVRSDCGVQASRTRGELLVTYDLFTMVMRLPKLNEIEGKFDHALGNLLQLYQGEQMYLVTISLDGDRNLVIRARDPVFKVAADFILSEDEYDSLNLLTHLSSNEFERWRQEVHEQSREETFTKAPRGLITAACLPDVNNAVLALLTRIRVANRQRSRTGSASDHRRLSCSYLSLVESDSFVATFRNLLSQVELPFFWSVSSRSLEFSIDNEYLEQQNQSSFQQLVAELLSSRASSSSSSLRALVAFISHTASSLLVRYEVVGRHAAVETTWDEFQAFISGHQDTYAILELHPQGELLSTRVARISGAGRAQWNFKAQIGIQEPKVCDLRIDRPVVFTDTVKVSCIPDNTPAAEKITFIVDSNGKEQGHFVVLSVRRALPSGVTLEKPRLYCTAYDPLTSCDYAVDGYPSDWRVDFFDAATNPTFESQWQAMLSTMSLGATLTPKLAVSVFNKQLKTDKLLGECEVSVGSAITLEGHIFEKRIALQPSMTTPSLTAGIVSLTFRFDVKKASKTVSGEATAPSRGKSLASRRPTGTSVSVLRGAEYLAGEISTPRVDTIEDRDVTKLQELQASIAAIEQAKLKAQEQVRQLQAQVQQLSYATRAATDDTAERWKRKLEQARQEQVATQDENASRYETSTLCALVD
ncbi:hypothetical protein BBJ28_00020036 [Nothophytophthora sp. Chile5]|nr:hypothetical protein BBJ28_00020036 [Nothophytophthora sp. Chile5]